MGDILMKCGHSAQGINSGTGKPVCLICMCEEVAESKPDLTGRKARCSYYGTNCKGEVTSRYNLAFFKHKPNSEFDEYYCGCFGWD